MKKSWKKEPIDILFPADPRRPEKRHLLALQTGEALEQRGWVVGITSLRHQPRDIVYDRMLTADVTLVYLKARSRAFGRTGVPSVRHTGGECQGR